MAKSKIQKSSVKPKKQKKTAVVMLNLGGPDSAAAVYPFLIKFFMDKNIIRLPVPFRCLLAVFIANRRSKREARESYDEIGGYSPLLKNTKIQATALQRALNAPKSSSEKFKTFVCMRYWHPFSGQVIREVKGWGADEIVLLPLYPQYSTTTTRSSLQVWKKAMIEAGMTDIPVTTIGCYPFEKGFINASAQNVAKTYVKAVKDGYKNPRILFSAHGLPKSVIKEGDPYQFQCEQGAEKIATAVSKILKIKNIDWQICYQSQVGKQKWIGPSTEQALEKAAEDGKAVVIYPHAFTQEHVETLVELDIEYREEAEHMGQKGYYRADTVSTHPDFINGLRDMVLKYRAKHKTLSNENKCLCPEKFGQCCMRETIID